MRSKEPHRDLLRFRSSANQRLRCGGERSEVPRAADREAEVHDSKAAHAQFGRSAERAAIMGPQDIVFAGGNFDPPAS